MKRLTALLEKALALRTPLLENGKAAGTNAFRLFGGESEGIAGLIVEGYGEVVLFQLHEGKLALSHKEVHYLAEWYRQRLGASSVYAKVFLSDRSHALPDAGLYSEQPLAGEVAPPEIPILENALKYLVRLYDGFSTGIFLDQRANRRRIAELSQGGTVLNCFSYTCAFSVACASRGARVTSVDLSKRYLAWGQENFRLNGLELTGHDFVAEDIFKFFKHAARKHAGYDLIILDPPSFSRNREGRTFSVRRDSERLLADAASLVSPGGYVFFSTNLAQWRQKEVEEKTRGVLSALGRWKRQILPPVPDDFVPEGSPIRCVLYQRE